MLYKLVYGTIVPLVAVFLTILFDLNALVSCIFMGLFTGTFMALFINHNLFIYTTGSTVVLFIANYLVLYYKHGDTLNQLIGNNFGNIFLFGAILLIVCVLISSLVVYFIKIIKR